MNEGIGAGDRSQASHSTRTGCDQIESGIAAPEGGYVAAPVLYSYGTDKVKDQDGNLVPITADITTVFFGGGYRQVTSKKIFAGQYGFTIMFPLGANNRIQGTEIDANPGAGLTDSAVTPISLGWHGKRADAVTGFSI